MTMTPAEWIAVATAVVTALVTFAIGYGLLRGQLSGEREKLQELREEVRTSNQDQGRRLGDIEGWRKAVEAVELERRRSRTGAVPIPPAGDESDS